MQTEVKDSRESTVAIVVELNVEELEEVIAPQGIIVPTAPLRNHNETLACDEVELNVEELEEVIAPVGAIPPSNRP
jgi:hypothetical protein